MAETGETENDLSALLDSALADFGRTRNTDDELDSMMDTMDQQAVQKAVQKFDDVMKTVQRSSSRTSVNSSETIQMTVDERKAAENFQNMLKTLIESEQKALDEHPPNKDDQHSYDQDSAEAFIRQLKNLSEQDPANIADESQCKTLINLVQAFFSKDLMYPPLKQLLERFVNYTAEHSELDAETKARYEKQICVIQRICLEYEKDDSEDLEEMKRRFDTITTLMLELQSYGYPPEDLVGEAPPGWITDPQTGLPKVDDISKAAESCSLM
ncbi:Pex19 family protein [Brugia pahangi]